MSETSEPSALEPRAMVCPLCQVFAHHTWTDVSHHTRRFSQSQRDLPGITAATCAQCREVTLWKDGAIIFPRVSTAPPCHADTPEDVKKVYEEASLVRETSPRAAAALLRLALELLLVDLAPMEGKRRLDERIGQLVKDGLPSRVQAAADVLRVVGNNSLHPGLMDIEDDPKVADALFGLLNTVVEECISRPRHLDRLYSLLPDGAKDAIERRDAEAENRQ